MEITKDLLVHWWIHYAIIPYTSEELEKFKEAIDVWGTQKIIDFITYYYPITEGKNILTICAIRANMISEMFETVPDPETLSPDAKAEWDQNQKALFEQLNKSYQQT